MTKRLLESPDTPEDGLCEQSKSGNVQQSFLLDIGELNRDFVDFCQEVVADKHSCLLFQVFPQYIQHFIGSASAGDDRLTKLADHELHSFFSTMRMIEHAFYANYGSVLDEACQTDKIDIPMPKRIAYTPQKPGTSVLAGSPVPATPPHKSCFAPMERSLRLTEPSSIFGKKSIELPKEPNESRDHILQLMSSISNQPGQWDCELCLSSNTQNSVECKCCGNPKTEQQDQPAKPQQKQPLQLTTDPQSSIPQSNPIEKVPDPLEPPPPPQTGHFETNAIFGSKCKFYYRSASEYQLRSFGFLSVVRNPEYMALVFRADNFDGTTMLSVRVNESTMPEVVGSKNVRFVCLPYPEFYAGQPKDKPVTCLFKMTTAEEANDLVDILNNTNTNDNNDDNENPEV